MISILFIHQSADLYGSDRTLLLLLKHIDREKFNPVVILPLDGPLKTELEKLNIEVYITPVLKIYRNIVKPKNVLKFFSEYRTTIKFLDSLHKEHHFNIIYSNTLAVLGGMIYAKKRKIKHIWHVHEIIIHPKIFANLFPQLLNKYADLVVCNSNSTLKNLTDRVPKIKEKARIIYNGIEENHQVTNPITKKEIGFNEDDIVLTLVGRINRLKGHKLLISVLQKYFLEYNNIKILFVGSPVVGQENYLHEIEDIIKSNYLNEKVKILPFTNCLNAIWKITDIVVMPSTEPESFGMVAAEAMLAKKPVIGSNHGGLTEIIEDNQTGFLVKPNDEFELANAIQKLIHNPDLRKEFGENGQLKIRRNFSIEEYISLFTKTFKEKNY